MNVELYLHQELSLAELEDRESKDTYSCPGFLNEDYYSKLSSKYPDIYGSFMKPFTVNTNLIVYSDKKGAGKTRVICHLLMRDKMPVIKEKIFNTYYSYTILTVTSYSKKVFNSSIIIVGPSILGQWETELNRLKLKYLPIKVRKDIPENVSKKNNIILVSTKYFIEFLSGFDKDYVFRRIIYDEPDTNMISNCPNLSNICQSLILVTATPEGINRDRKRGEFIEMIRRVDSALIKVLSVKQTDSMIDSNIALPPVIRKVIMFKRNAVINAILNANILPHYIVEMVQAGAIDEAYKALGVKEVTDQNLSIIATAKLDREIRIIRADDPDNPSIENQKRIEELVNKRTDILQRLDENKTSDCVICYGPFDDDSNTTICNHCFKYFHSECITEWFGKHQNCPNCRSQVAFNKLLYIPKKKQEDDDYKEGDDEGDEDKEGGEGGEQENDEKIDMERGRIYESRADAFRYLIMSLNKPRNRVLVFTGYDGVHSRALNEIKKEKISHASLKGGVNTRHKKLEQFKSGEINFLILDSREDSAGIDLPETTHIIIYHDMPENYENQIIGRGHRIGRQNSLIVYNIREE